MILPSKTAASRWVNICRRLTLHTGISSLDGCVSLYPFFRKDQMNSRPATERWRRLFCCPPQQAKHLETGDERLETKRQSLVSNPQSPI